MNENNPSGAAVDVQMSVDDVLPFIDGQIENISPARPNSILAAERDRLQSLRTAVAALIASHDEYMQMRRETMDMLVACQAERDALIARNEEIAGALEFNRIRAADRDRLAAENKALREGVAELLVSGRNIANDSHKKAGGGFWMVSNERMESLRKALARTTAAAGGDGNG